MAFVPVANTIEVFVEHNYNGKDGVGWVLHYQPLTAPLDLGKLTDLGATLITWWDTEMKPLCSNTTHLTRIRLRDLSVQNGIVADVTAGLPITGTRAGAALPSNVSLTVKKNTGYAGRSFRGRIYTLGATEGDITVNAASSAYANGLVAAFNEAILLVGAADEYEMVVVSKYSNNAPRPTGIVTLVQSFSLSDLIVDTRRDRL